MKIIAKMSDYRLLVEVEASEIIKIMGKRAYEKTSVDIGDTIEVSENYARLDYLHKNRNKINTAIKEIQEHLDRLKADASLGIIFEADK